MRTQQWIYLFAVLTVSLGGCSGMVQGDPSNGGHPDDADTTGTGDSDTDSNTGDVDTPPGNPCTSALARPGTIIKNGAVTGIETAGTWAWKGIPYAAPPLGDLRWSPPQAYGCWQGELAASAYGPMCPQKSDDGSVVGEEDCLTLNVWAPETASGAPVLFFVHGGGNTTGSTSDVFYDGQELATRTDSVVVTIEYRLGALGFFTHPGLDAESERTVSGNYGILDQIAALRWVKNNIAGFGGDPARVLLFGESAGGQDTLVHIASPLSKDLFDAAIVESGGVYKTTIADGQAIMQSLVQSVGCDTAVDVVACMRGKTPETLAAVDAALGPLDKTSLRYTPVVDGYVLPANAADALAAGTHNHVPLIIGTNADETGQMVANVQTADEYAAAVQAQYGTFLGNKLLTEYPAADYSTPRKALVRVTTDVTWTCPIRHLARLAAAHQDEPVFRYVFTWKASGASGLIYGSFHGLELPFVFRTFSGIDYTPTADDDALSEAMQRYWSRLAATGAPNGGSDITWPIYAGDSDPYLELGTTITAKAGMATAHCDYIDGITGQN